MITMLINIGLISEGIGMMGNENFNPSQSLQNIFLIFSDKKRKIIFCCQVEKQTAITG